MARYTITLKKSVCRTCGENMYKGDLRVTQASARALAASGCGAAATTRAPLPAHVFPRCPSQTMANEFSDWPPEIDGHHHADCWARAGNDPRSAAGWGQLGDEDQAELLEPAPVFTAGEEAEHAAALAASSALWTERRARGIERRGGGPAKKKKKARYVPPPADAILAGAVRAAGARAGARAPATARAASRPAPTPHAARSPCWRRRCRPRKR